MAQRRLVLASGGVRTEERRAVYTQAIRDAVGDAKRVLFVPHALADHDGTLAKFAEKGLDAGYELDGIHRHDDPVRAVDNAEAIYVGGGNTFRLVAALHRMGVIEAIRRRVQDGIPYVGVSAGSNVACPMLSTTNDMPIVEPPSFETLGLVPFQINPHYFSGSTWRRDADGTYHEHFGETRDDRLREFHEENTTPVLGLYEGAVLVIDGDAMTLLGGPARWLRPGEDPIDFAAGDRLESVIAQADSLGTSTARRRP